MATLEQLAGAARDGNDLLMLADALEEAGLDPRPARDLGHSLRRTDEADARGEWEHAAALRLCLLGRKVVLDRHGYRVTQISQVLVDPPPSLSVRGHGECWHWTRGGPEAPGSGGWRMRPRRRSGQHAMEAATPPPLLRQAVQEAAASVAARAAAAIRLGS